MNRLLIILFLSIVWSGCSVRSKALLQEQSHSSESVVTEERVIYQDTTITYGGDTISLVQPLGELLKSRKPVTIQTEAGSITLSLRDSAIIALAIWKSVEKELKIPGWHYRSTQSNNNTKTTLEQKQSKRQPFVLKFWPLWLLLLIILVFPLLKKAYKCLRFPM